MREIVGFGEGLTGKLMLIDALHMRFETMRYDWDPENPLSGVRTGQSAVATP
jgi:adenylyltransferase/sulfurtransferase